MATDTRCGRRSDPRCGGKTTTSRRVVVPRTPYERCKSVSRTDESQSPGWLSGFIFPATRKIATRAGQILSTVFRSDTSSFSDASSFESFSSSDGYSEYAKDETACSLEGAQCWNEVDGKNKSKIEIEQLIRKETFSRKECDRLIEIMKSRVVNNSSVEKDREMLDMRNRAILEAKRWIEEKRFGSPSASKVNQMASICSTSPRALELQIDSPADLAKSYIMARPPWSSPFSNLNSSLSEIGNSSKTMLHSHMTLRSGSRSNTKRKTDSISSGSWNILEEMRKVRSEATEDILKSFPSVTANLQTCLSEKIENKYYLASDLGGKKSLSLDTSKPNTIDTSPNMAVVIYGGTQVENGLLNIPTVSYSSNHQVMDFGHHADRTSTKQQGGGTENATEGVFDHIPASSMGRREVECDPSPVANVTVNREASLDMLMDDHEEEDGDIGDQEEWSPSEEVKQRQQQQQRGTKRGRCGKRGRGER